MAEATRPHTAEPKKEKTPEEKAVEAAEKEQKERTEFVDKVVKEVVDRVKEKNDWLALNEIRAQLGSLTVVAAGADLTPNPSAIRELTEKHTPYITPPTPSGQTPHANIVLHAEGLEKNKKGKDEKKAA